jgi:dihydropteroate synthase
VSTPLEERLARAEKQGRALVMAVVNVTPDSFYDGGRYLDNDKVEERIERALAEGADLLDLGAESSRPGAQIIEPAEQLRRLNRALTFALEKEALVSIDTTSPEVARRCAALGAHVVNDVSCLRDPDLANAAAEFGVHLVLTHSRVPMVDMPGFSVWPDADYGNDVVAAVKRDWERAARIAVDAGLPRSRLIFDPGFGFSKNARHSYELLGRLEEFRSLNVPLLSGPSRKSFLAHFDGAPASARLGGTIAASVISVQRGARIVRVHDVQETVQALSVHYASISPPRVPRP